MVPFKGGRPVYFFETLCINTHADAAMSTLRGGARFMKPDDMTPEQRKDCVAQVEHELEDAGASQSEGIVEKDFYKTLANLSQVEVYIVQDGFFRFVNLHMQEYGGYSEEQLMGMRSAHVIHPEDRYGAREHAVEMLKGRRRSPYEFRIVTSTGAIRWIMERVTSIHYRGHRAVLGNSMDITGRKEARSRLEELEALESSILDAIPHALIGLRNRRIYFANNAVETVFGWPPHDLIGTHSRILYRTDRESEEIGRRLYSALVSQRTFSMEFPCRRRDGAEIACLVRASRIGDSLHERRIVATFEDITERKRAEKELKLSREQLRNLSAHLQSAREKERTHVAREIHDELGQSLTALHMDVSWLKKQLPADPPRFREKAVRMGSIVESTMEMVHRISGQLRPRLLDDLGLTAAMEWHAGEFQSRSGIGCSARLDCDDSTIEKDMCTAVFRIFQESLTNVARHSRATRVHVRLRELDDRLVLTITDNGVGITANQIEAPTSFGIMGMRERAHLWGGDVHIEGRMHEGTVLTVSIPLPGGDRRHDSHTGCR